MRLVIANEARTTSYPTRAANVILLNFGDLDRFAFKVHVFDIKGFISLKVSVKSWLLSPLQVIACAVYLRSTPPGLQTLILLNA